MRRAKFLAFAGLLAMTLAMLNGFVNGDFAKDGSEILANPWGIVSLVDLYVGFLLFAAWIFFRETSKMAALAWTLSLMLLGFWAASLYVLLALNNSNEKWDHFWMGAKANVSIK